MIIDVTTPHGLKGRTTSDASPTALATSSQTTRSVNQKYLYTESSGSSSSRGSDILVPPTSFTSFQNHSVGEFCDPPPAYETIVVPSTSNTVRRFLKRSAHRSACATSQQSGESGESRGHTCSESWETIHISSSLRPVPENADSVTFKKLSRPFVIQAKTSKHKLPDLFSSVGTPALPTHDVHESDWDNLLQELVVCSRYSAGQRVVANVLPVTKCLGPPGCLANFAIEQGMRKSKLTKLLALLDTWNEKFFKPRKLEVILCKGDRCKSGRRIGFLAPDRTNIFPARGQNTAAEPTDRDYRLVVVSI